MQLGFASMSFRFMAVLYKFLLTLITLLTFVPFLFREILYQHSVIVQLLHIVLFGSRPSYTMLLMNYLI